MTIASTEEFELGTNLGLYSQQWGEKTPQPPHFWGKHLTVVTEHTLTVRFLTDRVLTGRQRIMAGVRSAGRSATAECRARSRLGEQQTLLSVGHASVHTCCFLWTHSNRSNQFFLNRCYEGYGQNINSNNKIIW